MDRRVFLKLASAAVGGLAAGVLPGCKTQAQPNPVPPGFRDLAGPQDAILQVFLGAKEFVVGNNRLPLALVDQSNIALDAPATLYAIPSSGGARIGPLQARFQRFESSSSSNIFRGRGFHEAGVEFPSSGFFDVMVREAGGQGVGFAALEVAEARVRVAGLPAPRITTPTFKDPGSVALVCSRTPVCSMHSVSLLTALDSGKPAVLVMATPRFCQSQVCGPVVDEVESLTAEFGATSEFIHAEFFRDAKGTEISDSAMGWELDSEPWVFVLRGDGTIAARFEGPVAASQIGAALKLA